MNKYGRAGVALLGIVALGGLVSLLGGPNVFSTFSSSISTLFPESDAPVTPTEVKNTQTEIPVVNETKAEEPEPEIASLTQEETSTPPVVVAEPDPIQKSPWIPEVPAPKPVEEKPKILAPVPASKNSETLKKSLAPKTKPAPKVTSWRELPPTSPEEFARRYFGGSGSKGSGRWCSTVTSSRKPWMLEGNEKCGN